MNVAKMTEQMNDYIAKGRGLVPVEEWERCVEAYKQRILAEEKVQERRAKKAKHNALVDYVAFRDHKDEHTGDNYCPTRFLTEIGVMLRDRCREIIPYRNQMQGANAKGIYFKWKGLISDQSLFEVCTDYISDTGWEATLTITPVLKHSWQWDTGEHIVLKSDTHQMYKIAIRGDSKEGVL